MGNHQTVTHDETINAEQCTVRNLILLWLDTNIDAAKKEYHDLVNTLRTVVDTVKLFTDSKTFKDCLTKIENEKVYVLISGSVGEHIIPSIHNLPQLELVFVFCRDRSRHKLWTDQWPKIRDVYTTIEPICQVLQHIKTLSDYNTIPMSFLNIDNHVLEQNIDEFDQSFVYTQMLKEVLSTIKFEQKHLTEFIQYSRQLLTNNERQLINLQNFEKYYYEKGPIWWFTKDCFLQSMLTYALREFDIELIMKLAFFIRHVHEQIKDLYYKQFTKHDSDNLIVYRGQGMSKNKFEKMRNNNGKLVSFNHFLLTSRNPSVPLDLAQYAATDSNLVGVFFRMQVDPSKLEIPIAFISEITNCTDKDDVLFSTNTVFRITDIEPMDQDHRVYQVHLQFINGIDENLRLLIHRIREQTFPDQQGWFRLNSLLSKYNLSVSNYEIYQIRLDQTQDNEEKARICNQIGRIKYGQGEYSEALMFYQRKLNIQEQFLSPDQTQLALSNSDIGNVYLIMSEYSTALTFYDKALEYNQKSSSPDYLTIASLYNNMGLTYSYMNDYETAQKFHFEALKIRQELLSPNHHQLAASYQHIAECYYKIGDYWLALTYYDKSLEIKKKGQPLNYYDIAALYDHIGEMYNNIGDYKKAISEYEKALDIFEKLLLPKQHNLAESYSKIASLYDKLGIASEAHVFYERATNIF